MSHDTLHDTKEVRANAGRKKGKKIVRVVLMFMIIKNERSSTKLFLVLELLVVFPAS